MLGSLANEPFPIEVEVELTIDVSVFQIVIGIRFAGPGGNGLKLVVAVTSRPVLMCAAMTFWSREPG